MAFSIVVQNSLGDYLRKVTRTSEFLSSNAEKPTRDTSDSPLRRKVECRVHVADLEQPHQQLQKGNQKKPLWELRVDI